VQVSLYIFIDSSTVWLTISKPNPTQPNLT
jgi:hypothetical protein